MQGKKFWPQQIKASLSAYVAHQLTMYTNSELHYITLHHMIILLFPPPGNHLLAIIWLWNLWQVAFSCQICLAVIIFADPLDLRTARNYLASIQLLLLLLLWTREGWMYFYLCLLLYYCTSSSSLAHSWITACSTDRYQWFMLLSF